MSYPVGMNLQFVISLPESDSATREEQVEGHLRWLKAIVAGHGGTVGSFEGLLSEDELEAMELSAKLAKKVRRIIGDGSDQAQYDWVEAAHRIHSIQHSIMAQAASRAYPERFRQLGGRVDG